jgi:hypothetical protein
MLVPVLVLVLVLVLVACACACGLCLWLVLVVDDNYEVDIVSPKSKCTKTTINNTMMKQ